VTKSHGHQILEMFALLLFLMLLLVLLRNPTPHANVHEARSHEHHRGLASNITICCLARSSQRKRLRCK
jgi:hypothetical protein